MKSFDEKWVTTLASSEDLAKRYKAFTSIKKACKDSSEDPEKYKQIINTYSKNIFSMIIEKLGK